MQKHGMLSDLPVSMYRYPTNSYLFSGFYQQLMTHIYNMTATITPLGNTYRKPCIHQLITNP